MLTHTRSFRIWLVLGCALLGAWLLLPPLAARAATLIVDIAVDESDGSCSDGDCSLRDAIAVAASGDTITFVGDYTIYLNGQLDLTKNLTIDGSGHTVIISGDTNNDGSANVRAFNVSAGRTVTLAHLTITRCYHSDRGAGVYNSGTLNVIDSTLSNNAGGYGGGAINNSSGVVTVLSSTLSGNSGDYGGAILIYNGTVVVQNSVLSGNWGSDQGGAIELYRLSSGSVTVLSSTVVQNSSGYGGGIYVQNAPLVVQNSLFLSNTSSYEGGGIYYDSTTSGNTNTIDNSTFIGNRGGTVDIPTSNRGGGAIRQNRGVLTVRNSTFSGNSAPYWSGGGINTFNPATILNSTFISNTGRNSTFVGGLNSLADLNLQNTIIAGSSGPDCSTPTMTANINNLIEDGSCSAGGVNFMSGEPALGPLADNGGPLIGPNVDVPLQTHALLPGSPAIDAGNAASCLASDQRGQMRDDLKCDLGAYELKYPDSPTVIRSVSNAITTTFGPTLIGLWRDAAFADPGVITVTKGAWGHSGSEAIAVRWDVQPTVTSGFSLTLQACYTPTELNGLTENQLRFWRSDGITFTQISTVPVLSTINGYHCASLSGIDQLSRWTLAVDTPTAITLDVLAAHASDGVTLHLPLLLAAVVVIGGLGWLKRVDRRRRA